MEVILSAISFVFVGLIVVAAFTIGFSLLLWFTMLGILISCIFLARQYWLRWKFLRNNKADTKIIEGVYTEITDKKP